MVSGKRKIVEPQRRQQEVYPNLDYYDWSSADDLSALAYTLRKVKKSDISRLCDNHEIDFIEKRFEDTSRVIFKDLEQLNLPLLQKAYKRPLKSDIVAIQGTRISSAISNKSVIMQANKRKSPENIPTIEEIWDAGVPQFNNTIKQSSSTSRHTTIAKNAVCPGAAEEMQIQQRQQNGRVKSKTGDGGGGGRRGGGICRVT